VDNWSISY